MQGIKVLHLPYAIAEQYRHLPIYELKREYLKDSVHPLDDIAITDGQNVRFFRGSAFCPVDERVYKLISGRSSVFIDNIIIYRKGRRNGSSRSGVVLFCYDNRRGYIFQIEYCGQVTMLYKGTKCIVYIPEAER